MQKDIEKYEKEKAELKVHLTKINNLISLYLHIEGTDMPGITEKKEKVIKRIDSIEKLVDAFRDVCEHKNADGAEAWVYEGHDSHKEYYVCTLCGKTDSY